MFAYEETSDAFKYIKNNFNLEYGLTVIALKNVFHSTWMENINEICTEMSRRKHSYLKSNITTINNPRDYVDTAKTKILFIHYDTDAINYFIKKQVKIYIIQPDTKIKTVDGALIGKERIPCIKIPMGQYPFDSFNNMYRNFIRLNDGAPSITFINNRYIGLIYRAFGYSSNVFNINTIHDYQYLYGWRKTLPSNLVIYVPRDQEWIMDSIEESVEYREYGKIESVSRMLTKFYEDVNIDQIMIEVRSRTKLLKVVYIRLDANTEEPYVSNVKYITVPHGCMLDYDCLFMIPRGYRNKIPFEKLRGTIMFAEYERKKQPPTINVDGDIESMSMADKAKRYEFIERVLSKDTHGNFSSTEDIKAGLIKFLRVMTFTHSKPIGYINGHMEYDGIHYKHFKRKDGEYAY